MSINLPLKDMTLQEKLAVMESIWEDLARTPEAIESPAWHMDILDERRQRLADGTARFTDWETAKAVLDCGYYISFSGIVSFKSAQALRDVAKQVPLDRLLIETDSPYLAPMPYRGKSNEPKYVPFVAKALSDVYHKTVEEIGMITTRNFENLLNLK